MSAHADWLQAQIKDLEHRLEAGIPSAMAREQAEGLLTFLNRDLKTAGNYLGVHCDCCQQDPTAIS